MRFPQTTGLELPPSGKGVFQRTFSVALHLRGNFVSCEMPSPVGPRKPGQFAALTVPDDASTITAVARNRRMVTPENRRFSLDQLTEKEFDDDRLRRWRQSSRLIVAGLRVLCSRTWISPRA
jgi:hypothetical protein